ncbi:hypothetical protein LK994_09130 [Ferruginibacter lapsinanis]|uniref:hypothetical protein n=1 Tax=Ferruginibacter lapsinanis TaxID=563172 RepID=UPI001E5BFC5B|nr:hypothetical protein [Ferruginibacter lapsinanis]UEG48798.1 hypothetical protein LK994_09130 [Ferruginibacter lapsinanis]
MKKVFIAMCMFLGLGSIAVAQKTPAAAKPTSSKLVKGDATSAKVLKIKKTETPKKAPLTKADGTPDMRFKQNKNQAAAAPVGPKKKNGTPDKRYKVNKEKTKS